MKSLKTQRGFTLVELLISVTIGLLVTSATIFIYISVAESSTITLKASKLNQELAAVLTVMTNDIRRAGYSNAALANLNAPQNNIFSAIDNTALEVIDNMTDNNQVAANSAAGGECIVYVYDFNDNGNLDDADIGGFRLNNGVVQMRQQGDIVSNVNDHDNCNDADDTWLNMTDGSLITVSALNFSLDSSECLNASEPNGLDDDGDGDIDNAEEIDCYTQVPANGSGDVTVETRGVTISVTGNLVNDPTVTLTLNEDIRVRNDLIRVR